MILFIIFIFFPFLFYISIIAFAFRCRIIKIVTDLPLNKFNLLLISHSCRINLVMLLTGWKRMLQKGRDPASFSLMNPWWNLPLKVIRTFINQFWTNLCSLRLQQQALLTHGALEVFSVMITIPLSHLEVLARIFFSANLSIQIFCKMSSRVHHCAIDIFVL